MGDSITAAIVTVVASLIAAASVAVGAVLANRGNARVKRIEATTPTWGEVVARLQAAEDRLDEEREKRRGLEDRVEHLEDDRRHDRTWIERTIRKVIEHDPTLVRLLLPWPGWYTEPTTPPTPD